MGQSLPKSGIRPMSAFPPTATELRTWLVVRFVPVDDINRGSLDHLIGGHEQSLWHFDAECLGGPEVDYQLVFGRRLHRQIGGLVTAQDAIDVAGCAAVLVD